MRVVVSNKNVVGRVTFNKVAKPGAITLGSLADVVTAGKQEGDVLVYQANSDTYVVKTLPKLDGGSY